MRHSAWSATALKRSLFVCFATIMLPMFALAQMYFGGIVGTVTDPSGAAIPGASITIVNTGTAASFHVTTNAQGDYEMMHLVPGVYTVTSEMKGFKKTVVADVTVRVSTTTTANVRMAVGAVTQSVRVTAATPLLDTTSGTVGTVVNSQSTVQLPLATRNFTQLMELVPGAIPIGSSDSIAGGTNFSISGNQEMQNNFMIDGVNDNESMFAQFAMQPVIDSIAEFKVQTNITSAEFGSAAGANIAVATKSGTNQFHGDVWEFLRNDAFDANQWFQNYEGVPRTTYRENQFGFTAGGPIYLPHIYNGKDKAWIFGDFEGIRFNQDTTATATVPSAAMLAGDFNGVATIYNPYTTTPVGIVNGATIYSRQQFPNNTIPSNMISPAVAKWNSIFYPSGVASATANNFHSTGASPWSQNQFNVRADYNFSPKLRSFFRVSDQHAIEDQFAPGNLPAETGLLFNTYTQGEASFTWLASPTTVVDLKSGFLRSNLLQYDTNPAPGVAAYLSQFPISGTPIQDIDEPMYPIMIPSGYSNPNQSGNPSIDNQWEELGNITIMHGKHTIITGAEFDHANAEYNGTFTSHFNYDSIPTSDLQNEAATGNSIASELLGLPSGALRNIGETQAYMHWNYPSVYVQDDIRATRKLTANLGLRWEYDQWPFERDNRLGNFDPVCQCYDWTGYNVATDQQANAPTRSLINPDYHEFAPRIGLAYELTPKTTVRAGFGMFYEANYAWQGQGARGQWPYAISQTFSSIDTPAPDCPVMTCFPAYETVLYGTPPTEEHIVSRNNEIPWTEQWNFGIQRQLTHNLMVEVDYVGNNGKDLPAFENYNDPAPGPGEVGSASHPRPEQAIAPTLGAVSLNLNNLYSHYNALQVKVTRNFSNGLTFLASYAYAHALGICGSAGYNFSCSPQNPSDLQGSYGNSPYDLPQIFTFSGVYMLPFGHGMRFLPNASKAADAILGGWQLTGILTAATDYGSPINIGDPSDIANVGPRSNSERPNYVTGQTQYSTSPTPGTVSGFLNPSAFVVQPQYSYGNLGYDTAFGPSYYNLDAGLFKNFTFDSEKYRLQFRSEYFNLTNNHTFGCIGSTVTTPGFGVSGCTDQSARIIQFALKFFW
jgi:Carboxypeptidase regulatory-like domain/TonB dependent receptor-like, beta-barrel